jgi:hypothetical protein
LPPAFGLGDFQEIGMTQNAKMGAPKEMATETYAMPNSGTAKAQRRMERICATPEEIERYRYDPNGARDNLRPGIPCSDYGDD